MKIKGSKHCQGMFSRKFLYTTQKMISQIPADLVTFTEEILNGKLHFLCSGNNDNSKLQCLLPRILHQLSN